MTSSWVSINLLEWLKELREVHTFISLLNDIINDTDGQSGEERHRVKSRKVLSLEFCPMGLVVSFSWCLTLCQTIISSQNSVLCDFIEASSGRHDQLFPAPLTSLGDEWWGWKFQASNHGLSGDQSSCRSQPSLLNKTKDAPSVAIT